MTQENAADRAQGLEETTAANESFAQDWLDAEKTEIAEDAGVAPRPRVVATLPDWSSFSKSPVGARKGRDWREILRSEKARTVGVAAVAFGLGVFCANGAWFGGEERGETPKVAATIENGSENEASRCVGFDETKGATPAIDSSTLRSVPNAAGVDALASPIGNAEIAAILQGGAGSANFADSANSADSTGGEIAVEPAASVDSNWRRGVDFERGIEPTFPTAATANVERYPTWEELETNGFAGAAPEVPSVAETASAPNWPVASTAPTLPGATVAANSAYPDATAQTAQNWPVAVGESADYAGFNGDAGYQAGAASNLPPVSPELAGISQNSGYNQVDGSENFAGFQTAPTAAAATVPNFASVPNAASTAPNFASASTAASTAPNFASAPNAASTAPNFASVPTAAATAPNFASAPNAAAPAPNFASVPNAAAPAPNFASAPNAAAPAPNFASVPNAAAPAPNFASVPNAAASTASSFDAPKAFVAQVPNETSAPVAPTAAPTNANLRW